MDVKKACQYGCKEGMSNSHALAELRDEITNSSDNKKCAIGVFMALKKAFDTVDRQLLCKKNLNITAFVELPIIGEVITLLIVIIT